MNNQYEYDYHLLMLGNNYISENGIEYIVQKYMDDDRILIRWTKGNKLHREHGPAVIFYNGDEEWWFKGQPVECSSQDEFERMCKLKCFW